jgi:hypothetical protein
MQETRVQNAFNDVASILCQSLGSGTPLFELGGRDHGHGVAVYSIALAEVENINAENGVSPLVATGSVDRTARVWRGLTLIHFSHQPEPFFCLNPPYIPRKVLTLGDECKALGCGAPRRARTSRWWRQTRRG